MLLRAFLSYNIVIGATFGGFGISVQPLIERYGAGRGAISAALALVGLAAGLLSPLAATSIRRVGLRATMMTGATLSSLGFLTLAFAPSIVVVLLAYAFLIGPAIAAAGSLPTSLLAGSWYPTMRGRAVGLATMPLLIALTPIFGFVIIREASLSAFYLVLAALNLFLVLALVGVRLAPGDPSGQGHDRKGEATTLRLIVHPMFWGLVLVSGVLYAIGAIDLTHMVAVLEERGVSPGEAAVMVSIMGGASVLGSFGVGFVADRIGGGWALMIVACVFALCWAIIAATSSLPAMVPAMVALGTCGSGVFTGLNVATSRLFGRALGQAIGMMSLCALPLTFLLPPAAGLLRDVATSYVPMMLAIVAAATLVALLSFFIGRAERATDSQGAERARVSPQVPL